MNILILTKGAHRSFPGTDLSVRVKGGACLTLDLGSDLISHDVLLV